MKTKILILSSLLIQTCVYSQVLLDDNFSGSSVNTSLWTVGLPESDSSVTEGGGYVALENAGRLTTVASMPTDYEIYGSFLMANNPFSNFKVVLRSNGAIFGNPQAPVEESAGIAFELNVEDDPAGGGSTTDNLKLFTIGNPAGDSLLAPDVAANLTLNTWHTFLITDNGFNVDLYFDGSSTPSLSGESAFSVGNLVTFYNRQGAASGSSISANGITEINEIEITQVPEPSNVSTIALGILSFIGLRKQKNSLKHKTNIMKIKSLSIVALCLLLSGGLRAHAQSLSNGLVAQFNLDGNALDTSGNGIIATLPSGVTWTTDRFGNPNSALDFGTGNEGVTGTGINLANSSSSISVWVEKNYVGDLYNGTPFLRVGDVGANGQVMHLAMDYGQSIRYSFWNDDFDINTPVLSENIWYNLTFTFDNTTDLRSIYVNGSLVATDTAAYGFTGDSNFAFGYENINLSDISFYNRVLTPTEVSQIYNEPNPVPEPSSLAMIGLGILSIIGFKKRK